MIEKIFLFIYLLGNCLIPLSVYQKYTNKNYYFLFWLNVMGALFIIGAYL